jgi:hypothetical protein
MSFALSTGQKSSISLRARRLALSSQKIDRESRFIDLLLDAPRFHPRAIRALATTQSYARAARHLERALAKPQRSPSPRELERLTSFGALTTALWERTADSTRLFRIAVIFEAVSPHHPARLTLEEFRGRSDEGARLTLAACGVIPDWRAASCRERAARCLNALVTAFRERSP